MGGIQIRRAVSRWNHAVEVGSRAGFGRAKVRRILAAGRCVAAIQSFGRRSLCWRKDADSRCRLTSKCSERAATINVFWVTRIGASLICGVRREPRGPNAGSAPFSARIAVSRESVVRAGITPGAIAPFVMCGVAFAFAAWGMRPRMATLWVVATALALMLIYSGASESAKSFGFI